MEIEKNKEDEKTQKLIEKENMLTLPSEREKVEKEFQKNVEEYGSVENLFKFLRDPNNLQEEEADINAKSYSGLTPLMTAIKAETINLEVINI